LHVLRNPTKLAFKGWEEVLEPWSFEDCVNYIEWCHIDKVFPKERHNHHRRFHKANLKYCIDEAFKNRCIEVYQVLYGKPFVHHNEVNLFIACGVHAEVKLNKKVDWSPLKGIRENITIPTPANGLIPMGARRYPEGGLGKIKTQIVQPDAYETEASSTDSDSDGSHAQAFLGRRAQQRAKRRRDERIVDEEVGGAQLPTNDEPTLDPIGATNPIQGGRHLDERDIELQSLYEEVRKLKEEVNEKNDIIEQQRRRIEDLDRALQAATINNQGQAPIEEDSLAFDDATPFPNAPPLDEVVGLPVENNIELTGLATKNSRLQEQLDILVEQYYQWKVACILTVDKTRQLATEFKKIDNNYTDHNQERVFGLTSWAVVDDLFNMDEMATINLGNGQTTIDWSKNNWDFKNEVSSTLDNQGNPLKLWPDPSNFVEDGTMCPICLNPFGPEGGMHLGTCKHMYHPYCLISLMVVRRRCSLCKAPFHERLYHLFGLVPYMPPHWEFNAMNAPDHSNMWGNDLVWS